MTSGPICKNGVTNLYAGLASIGGNFPARALVLHPGAMREAILANSTWLSDNDGPTRPPQLGGEWKVSETNLAAYAPGQLGGEAWSGNVGLRYVDIDQEINSYRRVARAANADVSTCSATGFTRTPTTNTARCCPART